MIREDQNNEFTASLLEGDVFGFVCNHGATNEVKKLKVKTCEGDSVVDLDGNVAYRGIAAHLKDNRLTVTYQTPTGKQILGCYTPSVLGGKSQGHGGTFLGGAGWNRVVSAGWRCVVPKAQKDAVQRRGRNGS